LITSGLSAFFIIFLPKNSITTSKQICFCGAAKMQ
jgi:hypothetical protein